MSRLITNTYELNDFFDMFFDSTVPIEGGTGALKKMSIPKFPYLRRYKASVKDFLSSEQIAFFDRRFRKIADKRGFSFTGSFGEMSVYFDINANMRGTFLVGFTFGAYVTNSLVDSEVSNLSTAELSLVSFVLEEEEEAKGVLEESFNETAKWLYTMAISENLCIYFNSTLAMIAEEPDITYRHFVIGYSDESESIPITVIPGIEKGAASNV